MLSHSLPVLPRRPLHEVGDGIVYLMLPLHKKNSLISLEPFAPSLLFRFIK